MSRGVRFFGPVDFGQLCGTESAMIAKKLD